jgi:hypothetical protein
MSQGLLVFRGPNAMAEAIHQGWQEYDRTQTGYLVRRRSDQGWMLAIVELAR